MWPHWIWLVILRITQRVRSHIMRSWLFFDPYPKLGFSRVPVLYSRICNVEWTATGELRLIYDRRLFLSVSYLALLLFATGGTISTKLYDKRDDFDFRIVNFPYICSNIPESPAYSVYISQVIIYLRACSSCGDFIDRGRLVTKKLVDQGFTLEKLKNYFRKCCGR